MKLPKFLVNRLHMEAAVLMLSRKPNHVIGGADNPYLFRWYLLPRNRFFNIYLHHILRDDDDRALHDHPWPSVSVLLSSSLSEVYRTKSGEAFRTIARGQIVFRSPKFAHRLVLGEARDAVTLFIVGPRVREWGFYCPKGWRHWREYTAGKKGETIGKGCD